MIPVDLLSNDEVEALVNSWTDLTRPLSKHLEYAVATAFHRRQRDLPPLRAGRPIPGCDCPDCTGIAADAPVRASQLRRCDQRASSWPEPLAVNAARRVSMLEVVQRFGLQPVKPHPNASEYVVLCPLHNDTRPSLRMNPSRNLWYCFPCAEGGDGIRLVERVLGGTFADAIRFLTSEGAAGPIPPWPPTR